MIIFIIPKNSGLRFKAGEILKKLNFIGEIVEIRGEDIPCFVLKLSKENKKAIGITGEDLFREFALRNKNSRLKIKYRVKWEDKDYLFQKPALCLLGPKDKELTDFGKNLKICINSKYKELAKKGILNILENKGYRIEKIYASGATEEFFAKRLADLIIDIVCSGKSAEEAGLKAYNKIFESDIVVIGYEDDKKGVINFDYNKLNFGKMNGLIPTIVQDKKGNVLMLAYSSKESLKKAIKTKEGCYYSRSRKNLWKKGETSGNIQELLKIKTDCDKDALIFIVRQKGNACHYNKYSCFGEENKFDLKELYNIVGDKIKSNETDSYTKKLSLNPNELKRKLVEEAGEVITAESRENLIWECSDLIYFLLVIMAKEGITIKDIEKESERRNKETLINKQNQPIIKGDN